jgi:abhydrolase domain-containing protein 15
MTLLSRLAVMDYISPWLYVGGSALAILTGYIFVQKRHDATPKLYHGKTALAAFLIQEVKKFTAPYQPAFFMNNGHLQTLLPAFLPRPQLEFERELIKLEDGGTVSLDWCQRNIESIEEKAPIIIVLPTLTGDANTMAYMCQYASEKGMRAVVFNKRGLGNTEVTTPKLQSFGDPHDLRPAVIHIRGLYPDSDITCVGSSAGSAVLVSYVGEYGDDSDFTAGVCISPGYQGEPLFNGRFPWPYDQWLLNNLKKLIKQHSKMLSRVLDIPAVLRVKTLAAFDNLVYCKMYGYHSNREYWKHNEPVRNIGNATTPILAISSWDDPVCISDLITFDTFSHPKAMLAYVRHGGHCGFLEGWDLHRWGDQLAIDYLLGVVKYKSLGNQL